MSKPHAPAKKTLTFAAGSPLNLIGAEWIAGQGDGGLAVVNPADGTEITTLAGASAVQVDDAVAAARQSFLDKRWRAKTPAGRQRILLRVAELIDRDSEILAELETLNGGKLFRSAWHGEVPAAAETFRYYAGWCTKMPGETFTPSVEGLQLQGLIQYLPVGVVASIVPWNGPLVMAAWKLAPALAAGCSVLIKPSELTPLTTIWLGQLLLEAGVPDGVVNIVHGTGRDVGSALVRHADVDKVSFTGSSAVGRDILAAAAGNMKRLTLELGGKSPVIIFDDADLEQAIDGAAGAIFDNAGQVCVAGSRVYAQTAIYEDVCDALSAKAAAMKPGSPWDEDSAIGPLISAAHRESVHKKSLQAQRDGARLTAGGQLPNGPGFFYKPTVLCDTTSDMAVVQEEVFGPVVCLAAFDTRDDAVRAANDSRYGLAASIWTRDVPMAQAMTGDIQAGIVWINTHGIPDMSMPIGGMKSSGWGREHGLEGLRAYLEIQSVMTRL